MAVSYHVAKVGEGSGYWDPLEVWSPGPGGISIRDIERHNNMVDNGATAANAARAYQQAAESGIDKMVGSANEGLQAILAQGGQNQADVQAAREATGKIDSAITNVNAQAGLLNEQAALINKQSNLVNQDADKLDALGNRVLAETDALKPYADQLNQYAGQLWNEGTSIFGEGQNLVDVGNGLMNLDENMGGVVGAYIKSLKGLSPERYVAQAAADVQGSFDNAKGQLARETSRSGLKLSGGAALAQKRLLAQTYAATLAGAKTRAWQTGATEQLNANRTALSDAMSVLKAGIDAQVQGATVQGKGTDAAAQAAGVQQSVVSGVGKAAEVQKSAADTRTQAAGIQKSAADAIAQAGTLYGNAGDLAAKQSAAYAQAAQSNNGYLSALNQAYGNVTDAYKTYTDFMASQAGGFAEYATSMGAGLFG